MLVDLPEKLICISVLFTEFTDNPDTLGRLIEESALFDTAADFEPFTVLSFSEALLCGYTEQSKGDKIEANDFEILRKIVAKAKHRVIAEGNINTPEKARHVIELGAYSVVVGSIITRPQLITKSFVEEMER